MGKARLAGSLGRDRERDTAATPSSPRECGLGVRHLGRLPGGHLPAVGDLRIHRKVADREVLLLAGVLHVHLGHAVDDADIAAHPHLAVARRSPAIVRLPACRLDTCSFLDSTRALECTYTRSSASAELSAPQSCFTIAVALLLGRSASESGTLRHGDGTHGRSDRCRRSFVLRILSTRSTSCPARAAPVVPPIAPAP